MEKNNLTPVQLLHSEYMKIFGEMNPTTAQLYEIGYAFEQAKQMEKEQILKACDFGRAYGYNQATGYPNPISNPEKYYNETYGKDKSEG